MPRTPRVEVAGGVYHVTARGTAKQTVFRDAADRHLFLRLVSDVLRRFGWSCLTYCLMDNHYHLLVKTPTPTLGVGMQHLNGRYSQRFNLRYSRSGHLWAGRYHSVLIQRDAHLLEVVRYIALNPVRARLCRVPEDWPWSGHHALAGLAPRGIVAVSETLSYLAAEGGDGSGRYRALVANINGV
jgi:putative transposase